MSDVNEIAKDIVDINGEYGFASVKDGEHRYLLDTGRVDENERLRTFVKLLQVNIAAALAAERAKFAAFVDEKGEPRKVLSQSQGPQWYMTTDGFLVPNTSAMVWAFEMHPGMRFSGRIIAMKYQTWWDTRWDDTLPARWNVRAPDGKWGCYSTREAAEAAALAAAKEQP